MGRRPGAWKGADDKHDMGSQLTPFMALGYSFLLGLLHGVLPDEHTWPITFSYAIGGASGKAGLRAGFYFSLAFTIQRAILSELSYLALARFLVMPELKGYVYVAVGVAMAAAGAILLLRASRRYPHLLHAADEEIHEREEASPEAVPVRWTLIHGFLAGFGFEGLFATVIAVGAPSMPSAWLGFAPGLMFGLGTMAVLAILGALFGTMLRLSRSLTQQQIARIGLATGARTLLYGGLLFIAFGGVLVFGLGKYLPNEDLVIIGAFTLGVALPAFIYSWREVVASRRAGPGRGEPCLDEGVAEECAPE
jgi:sulfite exporter TauE/SafE